MIALDGRTALVTGGSRGIGRAAAVMLARAGADVAIARMHEGETDCVLVLAGERLVGIFTDRDAVVKAAGKRLDSFHVRDFMTADPVVLRHDDPIAVAIHKMAVGGFRHIPIVEDGRPQAIRTFSFVDLPFDPTAVMAERRSHV